MQFEIRYPDTAIELICLFKPSELLINEFEKYRQVEFQLSKYSVFLNF